MCDGTNEICYDDRQTRLQRLLSKSLTRQNRNPEGGGEEERGTRLSFHVVKNDSAISTMYVCVCERREFNSASLSSSSFVLRYFVDVHDVVMIAISETRFAKMPIGLHPVPALALRRACPEITSQIAPKFQAKTYHEGQTPITLINVVSARVTARNRE